MRVIEAATESEEYKEGRGVANALWGEERANQLQKKIRDARGRTFIVVHDTMARQRIPSVSAKIDKALMRGLDAHWPVIFFEEGYEKAADRNSTTELKQHLQHIFSPLEPFIIETDWAHPVPSQKPPFEGKRSERWEKIRSLFTYLGVTHVRVGGIYLTINSSGVPLIDPRENVGCVNLVWKELSRENRFDVSPALGDGFVSGIPTTAREARRQLLEFLSRE